ncbi:hypothetical protein FACS1894139_10950 [Planctomycetales bacterium]|nr:hypothetical protein FACS1894139_10950 [Planctomycetales bacterium]
MFKSLKQNYKLYKYRLNCLEKVQRLMKLGVSTNNFITYKTAGLLGIREIWLSHLGLGDELIFLTGAREYYKQTGIKPLLAVNNYELFVGANYCYVLSDMQTEYVRSNLASKLFRDKVIKFLDHIEYEIRPGYRVVPSWPRGKHIAQVLLENAGVSGRVDVAPHLELSASELKSGEFARGKLGIMCGGLFQYKFFSPELAQSIIDGLPEYDFVQFGGRHDKLLKNALDFRGKSYRMGGGHLPLVAYLLAQSGG